MTDPPMMDLSYDGWTSPMMDPPMMDPPTHGHGKKEKQRGRRHWAPKITEEEEASSHGMREDVFDVTMLESALPLSPPLPTGKGLGKEGVEEEADGSIADTEMSEVEAKRLARKEEKARRKEEKRKRKRMFTHQTPQQHP